MVWSRSRLLRRICWRRRQILEGNTGCWLSSKGLSRKQSCLRRSCKSSRQQRMSQPCALSCCSLLRPSQIPYFPQQQALPTQHGIDGSSHPRTPKAADVGYSSPSTKVARSKKLP